MATTKKKEFNQTEIEFSDYAKALSHPARLKIIRILAKMDICMCGEIVDQLPLSQSTVSQHLKELKRVGLIKGNIDGPKVCYCINKNVLRRIIKLFDSTLSELNRDLTKKRSC